MERWNPNHDYSQGPEFIDALDMEVRAALRWAGQLIVQVWNAASPEHPSSWRDVLRSELSVPHKY